MNRLLRTTLLAATLASLVACQGKTPATAPNGTGGSSLENDVGTSVGRGMAEAQRKLETENITIRSGKGELHKAEITPTGGLIIDGKTIALNETQRQAVLDYRARTIDIAHAGMDIGVQGAKLATRAVTEAIGGLLSGHPDQIDKRIEMQTQGIKKAASSLCDKLPALQAAQQKVAAAVPEFAPFANIHSDKGSECKRGLDDHAATAAPAAAPATPAASGQPAPATR
ncbi:hypothetical protein [Cognatilysobacter lacus]|uniref:DUF2884 family protein n=1 Tax=Cognatilysobacter lacus TaxID=1643323 RepID=A0A5D8Z742_9GAMM|nr:hypothetical protein [Lysobacter lacus]TZF90601.1 hypothetical protein FW784_04630 [Lysobacter lacus]